VATGDVINSVQVMRCLMADLKRIGKSNGFSVDVKTVRQPDYAPPGKQDDEGWILAMAEDAPAILVWLDTETDDESLTTTMKDRPVLAVHMLCIVRQERWLQEQMQMLASDIRRIMRNNMNRDHPTATAANTWGVMTRSGANAFNYSYATAKTSTIGIIESDWLLTYNFPRATG